MQGKLIVIEGTDGSGKATQAERLTRSLIDTGRPAMQISFPRYGHPMARGVEFYLEGRYGTDPDSVNPYAASLLYGVDRFDAYRTEWGRFYRDGGTVIADRYTTSNATHQAEKLAPELRHGFLDWLYDLEYNKLGLPRPDLVMFLDADPDVTRHILDTRTGKPGVKHDIHERDPEYLRRCREAAMDTIEYSGWIRIPCTEDGAMLSEDEIHGRVLARTMAILEARTEQ